MKSYLWTILVLEALSVIGRLTWIARGRMPERTVGMTAIDAVVGTLFCAWTAYLLLEVAHG